jgi:hypothetical protein
MKKILLTLALAALTVTASYAQGYVQFANGTLTRVTIRGADGTVANAPAGAAITFAIFYGPSAGSPSDQASQPMAGMSTTTAGVIGAPNAYALGNETAPGDVVSMRIRGWSSSFGSDWQTASRTPGAIFGETDVRLVTLGTSLTATPIWQSASGTNPNRFNPLVLSIVPEPSTIALAVLGLGSLLLFRRRK